MSYPRFGEGMISDYVNNQIQHEIPYNNFIDRFTCSFLFL